MSASLFCILQSVFLLILTSASAVSLIAWIYLALFHGWFWRARDESAPVGAAPARRADLAGLPPAWIGVGSLDLFHDEDVAYGQRLRDCGVACEVYIVPGAFHGFDLAGTQIQPVREFRKSQIAALKRHLWDGGPHPPQ